MRFDDVDASIDRTSCRCNLIGTAFNLQWKYGWLRLIQPVNTAECLGVGGKKKKKNWNYSLFQSVVSLSERDRDIALLSRVPLCRKVFSYSFSNWENCCIKNRYLPLGEENWKILRFISFLLLKFKGLRGSKKLFYIEVFHCIRNIKSERVGFQKDDISNL